MNKIAGGRMHGNRVYGVTEETRAKISEKGKAAWAEGRTTGMRGKTATPASIAKRVAKNTGKIRTPEQTANQSAGLVSYYSIVDPAIIKARARRGLSSRIANGTLNGGRPKGIAMSAEQKAQQSLATKGIPLSATHRKALSKPKTRASCVFCRTETTIGALMRYHGACV